MKAPQTVPERLALRSAECARALGVDERTLRRWQKDEGLPFARVGSTVLFPVAELRAWLEERVSSERRAETLAEEILNDL